MSQLRDLKQIIGHPAHKLAGPVAVKEAEAQGLDVIKDLLAHICLHIHTHAVSPVGNDKIKDRPEDIGGNDHGHHRKEGLKHSFRQIELMPVDADHNALIIGFLPLY